MNGRGGECEGGEGEWENLMKRRRREGYEERGRKMVKDKEGRGKREMEKWKR